MYRHATVFTDLTDQRRRELYMAIQRPDHLDRSDNFVAHDGKIDFQLGFFHRVTFRVPAASTVFPLRQSFQRLLRLAGTSLQSLQQICHLNLLVLQRLPDFLVNRSLGYDNDRLGPFSLPDTVNPFESLKEMFKVVSR